MIFTVHKDLLITVEAESAAEALRIAKEGGGDSEATQWYVTDEFGEEVE